MLRHARCWFAQTFVPLERRRKFQSLRLRFGSGFERLEDREVPAVHFFAINALSDTPYDHFDVANNRPVDAIGNTTLRVVIEYANLNPETGNPAATTTR